MTYKPPATRYKRYAIYYVPEQSDALLQLADDWFGRSTLTGKPTKRPNIPGLSSKKIQSITKTAARYGFHGTLKAPFRLARSATERKFLEAVAALASDLDAARAIKMSLDYSSGFIAIRPSEEDHALRGIGDLCVIALDIFRAPVNTLERMARIQPKLSQEEAQFLLLWGYPYIFNRFRFHMTLTDPILSREKNKIYTILKDYFETALSAPLNIESICVCGDPGNGQSFDVLQRFSLKRSLKDS